VIVLSVGDEVLELLIEKSHPEFLRVASVLDVDTIDLDTIFVTFRRRPLTEEDLYAKIERTRREYRELTAQLSIII